MANGMTMESAMTSCAAMAARDAAWAFRNQPTSAMVAQALVAIEGVVDCLGELLDDEEEEGILWEAVSILHRMQARDCANRWNAKRSSK